jgi:hypothetical protein
MACSASPGLGNSTNAWPLERPLGLVSTYTLRGARARRTVSRPARLAKRLAAGPQGGRLRSKRAPG